jgi:hypothetical protein
VSLLGGDMGFFKNMAQQWMKRKKKEHNANKLANVIM